MIEVAFTNDTTVLQDADVLQALPALQTQVSQQFAPVWGTDALLKFYPKGVGVPPPTSWRISIADTSDQAGALGYHLANLGVPFGYAFVKSDIQAGASWTVTVSHELLEMLADPYVMCVVDIPFQSGWGRGGTMLAQEVCDAPEGDQFSSMLSGANGQPVKVSCWVTPAWFGAQPPTQGYPGCKGAYDFGGFCTQPFQILAGGYIGTRQYRGANPWGTVQGEHVPTALVDSLPYILKSDGSKMQPHEIPVYSRRHRRLANMSVAQAGPDPVVAAGALPQGVAIWPFPPTHPAAILGPVRNDADALIGQASGTLSRVEAEVLKSTNWVNTILANLGLGKTRVRITVDKLDPLSLLVGLEPKV